ncbi:MAG: hypothetical protein OXP36_09045 [Gammaproteobacteria bacterium]|nr:hypothetical protein [Gammaproteobacteria bacterium]
MADLVRVSVTEYLARHPAQNRDDLVRRARELLGRYHSSSPDLAENHDRTAFPRGAASKRRPRHLNSSRLHYRMGNGW